MNPIIRNFFSSGVLIIGLTIWSGFAIKWAVTPAYWTGSHLEDDSKTALESARRQFGPILLQTSWIRDPDGTYGTRSFVIQQWGYLETTARLILIIILMWVALCVLVIRSGSNRLQKSDQS
jgi:hypothetical protein